MGTLAERILRLARNAVLARILAKEEFGTMAILVSTAFLFECLADVGIGQSVVHNKRGAEDGYLNTAWWLQVARGVGLFIIAVAAAPFVASFYNQPELRILLRVCFLSLLFHGLASPRFFLLQKELHFGRSILITQGSGVLGTILTLVLVLFMPNVWALVLGFVSEAVFKTILSFILCPFLPSIGLDRGCLRELMTYAKGMAGIPILVFISSQIDVLVLGKIVSKPELGMYSLALNLARTPGDLFARVLGPVLLAFFAKKQDERGGLGNSILRLTRSTSAFGLPAVAILCISARDILQVVYGPGYSAVSLAFMFFVGFSFIMALSVVSASLFLGIGRPQLHRRFVIFRSVMLTLLIYPVSSYLGPAGAAAAVFITNLAAMAVQVWQMKRITGLRIRQYMGSLFAGCYPTAVAALPAVAAYHVLNLPMAARLGVSILGCGMAWFLAAPTLSPLGEPGLGSPSGKSPETSATGGREVFTADEDILS